LLTFRAVKLIRFFWPYARRYAAWALLAAVSVPVFAVASTAMVGLIEPIFGEVLQVGSEDAAALNLLTGAGADDGEEGGTFGALNIKRNLDRGYRALKRAFGITPDNVVYFVPLLFMAIFLVRAFAAFVSGYAAQHIGLGMTNDVRNDLYRTILDQSSGFHVRHSSGELTSRVVNDVTMMQEATSTHLLNLVQQSVTLVLLIALLLSTHLKLALICLVLTPIVIYPVVRFGRGMRRQSHRSQERMAEVTSLMAEGLRGHKVVKAFGMEPFEHRRFRGATRRYLRANLWAQVLATLSSPVIESLGAIGCGGLLIYAGLQIRAGELTGPILIQFLTNLLLTYDPIRKLNRVNLILQRALAAAHRVVDLMAEPNEIQQRPGSVQIHGVERGVEFREVRFGYDGTEVLHGVDLEVGRDEVVALVGPSGSGKSTLVNLLPRFFDVRSGGVLIDGRDVRDIELDCLRSMIGLVTQDTVLFDDTIRANIAYGRADASLDEVRAAARAAYAEEFIEKLPLGYETRVGEAGGKLSGGQRQRLAIARALFKDAPILILDEATSQLDSESEALVQKALHNLMAGRTTLVIAHRLSTVIRADRIVVIEDGRISEVGDHQALLDHGGTYKRLYDLQFEV
jgi:subfamily B ATP-binding cassette protein MsbA